MDYPDWLNTELFDKFLKMRIQAKQVKVNTDLSIERLINKLGRWRDIGYDIDAVIEHCTEKQYRGLFLIPGQEPRQKHLKASGDVRQIGKALASKHRAPLPETDEEKQRKADKARAEAKRLLGIK